MRIKEKMNKQKINIEISNTYQSCKTLIAVLLFTWKVFRANIFSSTSSNFHNKNPTCYTDCSKPLPSYSIGWINFN